LIRPRASFEIVTALARDAQDRAFARGELGERSLAESADRLAAAAPGLDDTSASQAAEVPRDERLRQPDMSDELRDGRLALRQAPDDPQPVDVGHDLVEGAQLAEVFGLGDGGGDRAADSGW
jgi:hypothetical protein